MTGTREEVVIVAADSEWRRTMQGDLEQAGYDVSVFESSAAAAASLHAAPPQVLLVDLTSAETPTHEASHNIAAADGPANPANDFHEMLPSLKEMCIRDRVWASKAPAGAILECPREFRWRTPATE